LLSDSDWATLLEPVLGVAIGAITGDLPFWLGLGIGLGSSMGTALGVVFARGGNGSETDGAGRFESV